MLKWRWKKASGPHLVICKTEKSGKEKNLPKKTNLLERKRKKSNEKK
jgi:hypothetical protein